MSEISRSTPHAPKPPAPANRAPNGNSGNAGEERGDAFSALLSLVAETRAAPGAAVGDAGDDRSAPAVADGDDRDTDPQGDDNPVAQLLGWADPRAGARAGAATATTGTPAAGPTPATADAQAQEPPTGVDISGMEALAEPEAIDPASLPPGALAARNAATAAATTARQADARDARVSSARRDANAAAGLDTVGALRASASAGQATLSAPGRAGMVGGVTETARGRTVAWANSTVSMDLSASREADSVAGNAVSLTARLSELLNGRAQPDGAAPSPLLGATQEASSATSEGPSPTDLLPTPDAPADAEASPLSHWSAQQLRHAHLRLGDGGLDSLDIRLSMQGQDLSVDFRSDNADIRQSLAQQANQSLASLLERSGIALADVSVGAQNRQPGGQGASSDSRQGQGAGQGGRGAIGRDAAEPLARPLAPSTPRADGSRPLDLFV